MSYQNARKTYLLGEIGRFSRGVLRMPLYDYQARPLAAVIDSVLHNHGREYLLVFSRQSGKNEAVAHLLVYLLNLYRRRGGSMVYAAIGDGLGRGRRRLHERLNNPWNRGEWRKASRPMRTILGQAAVMFISSHPGAAARGETADRLLVVDELQDQDPLHLEAVFTPMRAAHNATAVYLGTVRSRHDALWLKKEELEKREAQDGVQRVYGAGPDLVTAANPQYGRFLQDQVARYGRFHPVIASEYYLEPLESDGALFPPRRLKLMQGTHSRQLFPIEAISPSQSQIKPVMKQTPPPKMGVGRGVSWPGGGSFPHSEFLTPHSVPFQTPTYVALLDVGGQDEAATGALDQLANPARDYTICTIVQIIQPEDSEQSVYHAVDVFVDHGSRHFAHANSGISLSDRLLAYLESWSVIHLVADAGGVGEGLVDWLAVRLGRQRVTPYKFTRLSKAALGAAFLALVETGRFKYWIDDKDQVGSDGWWFWQQAAHCLYELPPGGLLERNLRWYVPPTARVSTPTGPQPVHDDRLLSAALVAEADKLIREGKLLTGQAESAITTPYDPLNDLPGW